MQLIGNLKLKTDGTDDMNLKCTKITVNYYKLGRIAENEHWNIILAMNDPNVAVMN